MRRNIHHPTQQHRRARPFGVFESRACSMIFESVFTTVSAVVMNTRRARRAPIRFAVPMRQLVPRHCIARHCVLRHTGRTGAAGSSRRASGGTERHERHRSGANAVAVAALSGGAHLRSTSLACCAAASDGGKYDSKSRTTSDQTDASCPTNAKKPGKSSAARAIPRPCKTPVSARHRAPLRFLRDTLIAGQPRERSQCAS